jgi:hypothetical protein
VKRNAARFPKDFIFRASAEETETLNRSQSVTGSQKHRDPRLADSCDAVDAAREEQLRLWKKKEPHALRGALDFVAASMPFTGRRLEQTQIDGGRHGRITCVIGMQMIAAVILRIEAQRVGVIANCSIEIDHSVERL